MTSMLVSRSTKLINLAHELAHNANCRALRTYAPSGAVSLDIVRTESLSPCTVSQDFLVENLLRNGFQYIDKEYLLQGYIRAKYDREFDIWADSRQPLEPNAPIIIDFSGNFSLSDDIVDDFDLTETMETFLSRLEDAIRCLDSALRDNREDLQRMFGPIPLPHSFPWISKHSVPHL